MSWNHPYYPMQGYAPGYASEPSWNTAYPYPAEYVYVGQSTQAPLPIPAAPAAPSPDPARTSPESLSAGMAAGWLVALAAVGFIFFRVAILKRPL